ncbi:hypothetical protein CR513_59303, partial [Mucuna pruriens]
MKSETLVITSYSSLHILDMVEPTYVFSLLVLTLQLSALGVNSANITLVNQCSYTVWPVLQSSEDTTSLSTTGFILKTGKSFTVTTPATWNGRIWGRTLCTTDTATGKFSCVTADCGSGKVECGGNGCSPPATMVEIAVGSEGGIDFYDVSLVDGFNVPVMVVPMNRNCGSAGCPEDLNLKCPTELSMKEKGQMVACNGACAMTFKDIFCCTGDYSTQNTCHPTVYSQIFKIECPKTYSYPYDDFKTSQFNCSSAHYTVVFCPASNNASV